MLGSTRSISGDTLGLGLLIGAAAWLAMKAK